MSKIMGGKTIGLDFNYGFAGSYARQPDMVIDTHRYAGSNPAYFGDPVMLNTDGSVTKADVTLTADNFAGVASKEIRTQLNYSGQNEGGNYTDGDAASIFKRGAISVLCMNGNPAPGGDVYVRIALNPAIPISFVGSFDAAADGTNTVKLLNCVWKTDKDANNIAELLVRTRNN